MQDDNEERNIFCPDGVEFVKLGDISQVKRGVRVIRKQLDANGIYAVYQNSLKPLGFYDKYNCKGGTAFVISAGSAGEIGYSDSDFWAADDCMYFICDEKIMSKYLYYVLMSLQYYILSQVRRAAVPRLSRIVIENLEIPLPPLDVQEKIVYILDKFTELTRELTRELTLRKKQYEYYRDELLTNPEGAKFVKLGDIATITRGGNFQKKHFVEHGRPCIHYGQIHTRYGTYAHETFSQVPEEIYNKSRKAQPGDIVMATTSEDLKGVCKCVAWLGDEPAAVSGDAVIIHHEQDAKYMSYLFQSDLFYSQKIPVAYGVKVTRVSPDKMREFIFPIPPIEEQRRISSILDKFDTLCNDLTKGIPAEIEKRKKQYEYYRDKLLTFTQKS